MSDYAATAKRYAELATRATDPEIAEAYRNLASGYQLLARGTELLHRHDAAEDGTGTPRSSLPPDVAPTRVGER